MIIMIGFCNFIILDRIRIHLNSIKKLEDDINDDDETKPLIKSDGEEMSTIKLMIMFSLVFYYAVTFAVHTIIRVNATEAYGDLVYQIANSSSYIFNPLLLFYLKFQNLNFFKKSLPYSTATSLLCVIYMVTVANLSPNVPMKSNLIGSTLIVSVNMIGFISLTTLFTSLSMIFRSVRNNHTLLYWFGIVNALSSLLSSISMTLIVNLTNLFSFYDPCV